ncbi:hypothetical protein FQA47_017360 [Oryzias melastigma]|uniref:Uncharacterized protein n=1 Tax=Oryzias melastigma TaxID=30732 RepID=A0A834F5Z3_ORYME|nr:hypothetical protein FQA47_017360 [Oryzias melastigma]
MASASISPQCDHKDPFNTAVQKKKKKINKVPCSNEKKLLPKEDKCCNTSWEHHRTKHFQKRLVIEKLQLKGRSGREKSLFPSSAASFTPPWISTLHSFS